MKGYCNNYALLKERVNNFLVFCKGKNMPVLHKQQSMVKLHGPLIFEGKHINMLLIVATSQLSEVSAMRYFKVLPLIFCRQKLHHVSYSSKLNERVILQIIKHRQNVQISSKPW